MPTRGGRVLSNQTGHFHEYGTNPYTAYDDLDNSPRFLQGETDPRLPPMERLIDIHVRGRYKAYPMRTVREKQVINDIFGGEPVVLFYTSKTVSALDESLIAESKQIGAVMVFVPELDGQRLHFVKMW